MALTARETPHALSVERRGIGRRTRNDPFSDSLHRFCPLRDSPSAKGADLFRSTCILLTSRCDAPAVAVVWQAAAADARADDVDGAVAVGPAGAVVRAAAAGVAARAELLHGLC